VKRNLKTFCSKLTHSKEERFFKELMNSSICNKFFVLHGITCVSLSDYSSFLVLSGLDKCNVPLPAYFISTGILFFHVSQFITPLFFYIFKKDYSIFIFVPKKCHVYRSFLPP
jgi:hypothetical protein